MKRPDQVKTAPDQGYGERVPPGQFVTTKFPVLTYGPEPTRSTSTPGSSGFSDSWSQEISLDWKAFTELPVAGPGSRLPLRNPVERAGPDLGGGGSVRSAVAVRRFKQESKFIMAHCFGGLQHQPATRSSRWKRASWPTSRAGSRLARATVGPCASSSPVSTAGRVPSGSTASN